jgi:cephalosporin-C deacetylase-like acetyl esterase
MRLAFLMMAAAAALVAQSLDGMTERYLTRIAEGQWAARRAAIARIQTPADVAARQEYIRRKLLEEVGGLPARTPLNARITGSLDRGAYRVDQLVFESQPRFYVTANLYVPAGAGPFPAVLGVAGHSADSKAEDLYQHTWISLARRGFLVLAYDPPGQGERIEYLDPATGKSRASGPTGEHTTAGLQCLLTGTNIARYFIWDGIRAVDYLLTRPDVDAKRIAVTGNSGGGTQSSYLAAFEPRLAAAAPSCYLTTWEKLWAGPGPQDAEQDFVNFLKDGLDFADFLIAFAPKPIHMAAAVRDYFPIEGARGTYEEARALFKTAGAADHVGFFEFDDTHGWSKPRREATYRWLTRWLQNRSDDGIEDPDIKAEPAKNLLATPTGQVATSFPGAATVQSLNAVLAEELYAKRSGAGGRNIPALLRARLAIGSTRGAAPSAVTGGDIERSGYRIRKIELQSEPGITIPVLAFLPEGGPARKPAVLYLNAAGKSADAGEGGALETLARARNVVFAIDARGWGESGAPPEPRSTYSKSYQTAMRAMLVGKNLPGMRTEDILRAFDYAATSPDVAPERITLISRGDADLPALFAAALEPRIAAIQCETLDRSYMDLVRAKMPGDIAGMIVPGALIDFDLPDVVAALGPRAMRP